MVSNRPGARLRRRVVGLAAAGVLIAGTLTAVAASSSLAASSTTPYGNLSEALHKSLYFYDAEKSGPSRSTGHQPLEWRGDSEVDDARIPLAGASDGSTGTNLPASFVSQYRSLLDPDGDGRVDLSGGFHDAGDHVKFGLPQAYAAATLGWGVYEFRESFVATGAYEHVMEELRWFSDYFLRSTFRDPASGDVIAFNYMVGRGGVDHTYWGPPELQDPASYPRPATFAYAGAPASDQATGVAAALTIQYLNTRGSDSAYAQRCLETAQALYRFAVRYRGLGNGDGFYPSSYDDDEMSWAAVWLYIATGTQSYLTDIIGTDASGRYTGYLKKIIAGPQDTWQNIWVHSWDTVWGGVFAKLAPVTKGVIPDAENQRYWYYFRWNVEYWSGGAVRHDDPNDTNFLTPSPGGFGVVSTWGSARYNTAAQLSALAFRKYAPDDPKAVPLSDWALSQMNYIMGDNPLGRSYIVGFGDDYARHPHHRAAHGSSTNSMLDPPEHRHTLWGALVGGPDGKDQHKDETTDYVYNEVAIDYNAAFVGALAGLYTYYGSGQPVVRWTPPAEPQETPFYANAKVEQENKERSQITVQVNNYITHPPQFVSDLSLRYYFDISELMAHGQTIDDVRVEVYYDESGTGGKPATVSGPTALDAANGVYYITVAWQGVPLYAKRDLQFALVTKQDSQWQSWWDPTNDYSRNGLGSSLVRTERIPVYRSGVKVFGSEPGAGPGPTPTVSPTVTPTVTPTVSPTVTPTSSPSPTPGTTALRAQYSAGETGASTVTPRFRLNLINAGTSTVDLTKVKIRYWYTRDNTAAQTYHCDYAVVTCARITGTFGTVSPGRTGADAYLDVGFNAGTLGAGASTGEIQNRFNHDDWSAYTQTGDYSFDSTKSALADWNRVTVTYDGVLVWGTAP